MKTAFIYTIPDISQTYFDDDSIAEEIHNKTGENPKFIGFFKNMQQGIIYNHDDFGIIQKIAKEFYDQSNQVDLEAINGIGIIKTSGDMITTARQIINIISGNHPTTNSLQEIIGETIHVVNGKEGNFNNSLSQYISSLGYEKLPLKFN